MVPQIAGFCYLYPPWKCPWHTRNRKQAFRWVDRWMLILRLLMHWTTKQQWGLKFEGEQPEGQGSSLESMNEDRVIKISISNYTVLGTAYSVPIWVGKGGTVTEATLLERGKVHLNCLELWRNPRTRAEAATARALRRKSLSSLDRPLLGHPFGYASSSFSSMSVSWPSGVRNHA